MVGAFYQPRLVYMNMEVLRSLPERQFAGGMGGGSENSSDPR